ncbi:hemicentin-1-like [Penaeus japonicus]|uniref:hemicentin-1-like n=1 Tax=Penaeus japonicus TaxID=27405 RepID=UPI001C713F16|nr:hemicentin-1-like [Penaeus japonicus]
MLRAALFLTAILAVAGDAGDSAAEAEALDVVDPSSLVGQLTVLQLKELIAETLIQAMLPLHKNCTDYSETGDCNLVVENDLCNEAEFYARYCCRSCTLAKQIPTYGPHLSLTAEAPITANITTESVMIRRGSNITLTCEASGFPTPDIVWFVADDVITGADEDVGGILLKTRRSTITIPVHSRYPDLHCECLAIAIGRKSKTNIRIEIEDDISLKLLPEVTVFEAKADITLECIAEGSDLKDIAWKKRDLILESSDRYNITEERTEDEDGVTRIHSKLSILRQKIEDNNSYFLCSASRGSGGSNREASKVVVVKDVDIDPSCIDLAGKKMCYEDRRCEREYVQRYCCRTCTLAGALPSQGPHLHSNAEAPLMISIWMDSYRVPYGADARLACWTAGFPGRQNATWHKGDSRIEESEHYQLSETTHCTGLSCEVRSTLTIREVTVRDVANYTCRAVNQLGEKDRYMSLKITRDGELRFQQESFR